MEVREQKRRGGGEAGRIEGRGELRRRLRRRISGEETGESNCKLFFLKSEFQFIFYFFKKIKLFIFCKHFKNSFKKN